MAGHGMRSGLEIGVMLLDVEGACMEPMGYPRAGVIPHWCRGILPP